MYGYRKVGGGVGREVLSYILIKFSGLRLCFVRHRSEVGPTEGKLALQLLLQLVKEAPVSALRDELLRCRLDEPDFMQAQSEKAHRVFRVVLAPLAIRNLLHRLQGVVVVRRRWRRSACGLIHEQPGDPFRLAGADVCRFQDGAERPLSGSRVLPHELSVADRHTAEVL